MTEEAHPEAAAILAEAGWKPHDGWNVYTRDTLVMGFQPDGLAFHVKNWAAITEGHPQWTSDTPDTAEEAAAWLVERFKPALNSADESNGETGEETSAPAGTEAQSEAVSEDRIEGGFGGFDVPASDGSDADGPVEGGDVFGLVSSDPIDAEYFEPADYAPAEVEDLGSELLDVDFETVGSPDEPALLEPPPPEDFAPDDIVPPEDPSGAFIFGDNLHQMRTAAIGLVVQAALLRLPEPTDYAKLSELRNFAMGVSEGRWPDDPTKRDDLDAMEAIERRRHAISTARDEKVAFLIEATREQIEDFSPEVGWPE